MFWTGCAPVRWLHIWAHWRPNSRCKTIRAGAFGGNCTTPIRSAGPQRQLEGDSECGARLQEALEDPTLRANAAVLNHKLASLFDSFAVRREGRAQELIHA